MLKHLLVTTLRYFYRQRFIVLINMAGLLLGITISIIIFLHLIHEVSFDKEYIKGDNIYNVIRCDERQKWTGNFMNPREAGLRFQVENRSANPNFLSTCSWHANPAIFTPLWKRAVWRIGNILKTS